jgi:hypothetical protein
MSSSSVTVALVAIVTAVGLLARYRPAVLQAADAARARRPRRWRFSCPGRAATRPCSARTAAGHGGPAGPGIGSPPGSSPRSAVPGATVRAWPGVAATRKAAATGRRLRHVLPGRPQRTDHAGRRDRDGCLPAQADDISGCTGRTIFEPAPRRARESRFSGSRRRSRRVAGSVVCCHMLTLAPGVALPNGGRLQQPGIPDGVQP